MGVGSGPPFGGVGSVDGTQFEAYGVDPSIAPGLPRPEGWRVGLPDGSAAWDKTGPLDTNWTLVAAAAPSGVQTVTGNPAALVDNTDPQNPVVQPSFGESTTIQKANAASTLKTILQLVAAYTNNAAGVEASNWTISVLKAGAQIAAQIISGVGTLFPDGVFDGVVGNTRSSVAIGVVGTGLRRFTGINAIAFQVNGREIAYIGDDTSNGTGHLRLLSTFGRVLLGDDCIVQRSVDASSSQANLQLRGTFGGAETDVVVGPNSAAANNATGGFLQLRTQAGTPTGTPLENTGHRAITIGDMSTTPKLYVHTGGGTWVAL